MPKPVIGITAGTVFDQLLRDRVNQSYSLAVQRAGGIPVLLSPLLTKEELIELRSHVDGVVLSGGGDIDQSFLHGETAINLAFVDARRDKMEFALVKVCLQNDWPVLGICRGCQVMNEALGGQLYTDVPGQRPSGIRHNTPEDLPRDLKAHSVTLEKGTQIVKILETDAFPVNSLHHQAIEKVADGLRVNAHASDGLIEGIEHPEKRFFIGVQWHPEELQAEEVQRRLFSALVQAAGVR